jgi:predicted permease
MGATQAGLIRQLMIESLVLWVIAGILGLGLGFVSVRALLSIDTAGLPRVGDAGALVQLDWRSAAAALGAALISGVVFGLIPAMRAARVNVNNELKDGGGPSLTQRGQKKLGALLIVAQVTLAVVLLIGAGLLIRSQVAMVSLDPGFDHEGVLVERTLLAGSQLQQSAPVERLLEEGITRLRAIPAVVGVAASCCLPFENGAGFKFRIIGSPAPQVGQVGATAIAQASWGSVTQGYFEVLKIPLKRGRTFTDRDTGSAPPVVIIDEAMAREYWSAGEDPLDSLLAIGNGSAAFANEPARQIVGVVGDVRDGWGNSDRPGPHMYVPLSQQPDGLNVSTSLAWLIRTNDPSFAVAPIVSKELRRLTGGPPLSVRAMTDIMSGSRSRSRFNTLLMTSFGGVALLLAAVGIFGLIANIVEQQMQEIGIRKALGATPRQVENRLLAYGALLLTVGAGTGTLAASTLSRLISGLLFQVRPLDSTVFLGIPIVLILVGLCAVWIAARRARRIEPLIALRAN